MTKKQPNPSVPPPTSARGKDEAATVDHPQHYGGDTTYETIKVIEAWSLDFCLGNAVKYISRAGKKGDAVEDLKKAAWYVERRIKQLEADHAE